MKTCTHCKQEKQFDDFRKDKHQKDGHTFRCKECLKNIYTSNNFPRKETGSKPCMHCKEIKQYSDFSRNKANSDGLMIWCKPCASKKQKEYRLKNPENWERQRQKNFVKWRETIGVDSSIKIRKKSGEGYINRQGYLSYKIKDHPCADKNGRVQASHLVIYKNTGKILKKGESVHHKNGMRLDNRLENLEIWSTSQPAGQRVEDKIEWCIDFLSEYGYKVEKIVDE
jgi:HNH endonuclease